MTTIDPEAPCWEEALEGGAYGKQLWRAVLFVEWSFWDDAWWWWSPANWSWIRAGGERHVRWWRGTYWVATAWIPPCADPHGTIAPPPDVAPGGGHRTDVATAPLRLTWPPTWPPHLRLRWWYSSSTDDDLDEDEPWTEVLTGARRLRELVPTGRAYWR